MNENRTGPGYQNFEEIRTEHIFYIDKILATGYLKVEKLEYTGRHKKKIYTLSLTNMEVEIMFENMALSFRERNVLSVSMEKGLI